MNNKKAVILDRDGTINIDYGYVGGKDKFVYLDGAVEGLKRLSKAGVSLIIVTNQSGIARGYFSESQYEELTGWMIDDLKSKGIEIDATYYCPHHPEADVEDYKIDCDCRKPKLGLFEKAISDNDLDLDELFVIGDSYRDVALCDKYRSVRGIVLYSDHSEQKENIRYIEGGLDEASKIVLGTGYGKVD